MAEEDTPSPPSPPSPPPKKRETSIFIERVIQKVISLTYLNKQNKNKINTLAVAVSIPTDVTTFRGKLQIGAIYILSQSKIWDGGGTFGSANAVQLLGCY